MKLDSLVHKNFNDWYFWNNCKSLGLQRKYYSRKNKIRIAGRIIAIVKEKYKERIRIIFEEVVLQKGDIRYVIVERSHTDDKLIPSYEWVRSPSQITPEEYSIAEEEIFIDFTANAEIKK
ncbi:unnamed protein product [Acanthoscelides obtectus]|uniref:Uncharacterized protein n=1 Tax=Acanthoscelides obtectus TaxID=200917 RepID=A0A9P0M6S2_ACAOB|nr:unnamed protein product [Acanthoscelides obtectus]CAK1640638.1 hypothetical protein AOBTE_LOCUS11835 [Acanthoscelides obtectus]